MKLIFLLILSFFLNSSLFAHLGISSDILHPPIKKHEPPSRKLIQEADADLRSPPETPLNFEVLKYALDIKADPVEWIIEGTSYYSLKLLKREITSIKLDAYDMKIDTVLLVDQDGEKESSFNYDGEILEISLPQTTKESYELKIKYKATRSQSFHTAHANIINPSRMQSAYTFTQPDDSRKWFPCPDRPSVKAPFEIKITVPENFNALSNGTLVSLKTENKERTFHYKETSPIAPYLVSLAIGSYEIISLGDYEGKALTLWTPPKVKDAALFDTQNTKKMMEIFSQYTGVSYPFASYTQSIAPAWDVSMEHQGATTLGAWVIAGDGSDEATIAHELAHQWFGNHVTPEHWGDLWLSEGFASFFPFIFYESHSKAKALAELDGWRETYFLESKKKVRALYESQPDLDTMFDAHTYDKAALVIKLIRFIANRTVSNDPRESFNKALQYYLQTYGGKTVRHENLQESLEHATGISWQNFFDTWIKGIGHPQLEIRYTADANKLILKIKQKQTLDTSKKWPSFRFLLPVDLYDEKGTRHHHVISIQESEQEIMIPTGFEVSSVSVDPEWEVPAEIELEESDQAWLFLMNHASSITAQMDAMRALLKKNPIAADGLISEIIKIPSLYALADALVRLSKYSENKSAVLRIIAYLETRNSEWDRIIRNAVVAAEAWVLSVSPELIPSIEEKNLQEAYKKAPTVGERKSILSKLALISMSRAQEFGIQRLQEPRWSLQDRANIIDLVTKFPQEASRDFFHKALETSNHYWFRRMAKNLITIKYDNTEMVPFFIKRATQDPMISDRIRAVEVLSQQKKSLTTVCPVLKEISTQTETKPDRLSDLRESAKTGLTALGCILSP